MQLYHTAFSVQSLQDCAAKQRKQKQRNSENS
jgi:hypothetical protein